VDFDALVGQFFLLDGENWEVVEADASTRLVKYTRATMERAGDVGPAESDTDDELEDATEAESAALAAADTTEIGVEETLALLGADDGDQGDGKGAYSPDPDVRLIRNVWARKGVMERVTGTRG
jgi:hypothetical protein